MNILDIIIILPIAYGLIRGLFSGLVQELTAIVALIAGVICAKLYAADVAQYLMQAVTWDKQICEAVAYSAVFLAVSLLLNIVGRLLARLLSAISLGGINKLLGGVFGAAKWALLVAVILTVFNLLDQQFHFLKEETKQASVLYEPLQHLASVAWEEAMEITK